MNPNMLGRIFRLGGPFWPFLPISRFLPKSCIFVRVPPCEFDKPQFFVFSDPVGLLFATPPESQTHATATQQCSQHACSKICRFRPIATILQPRRKSTFRPFWPFWGLRAPGRANPKTSKGSVCGVHFGQFWQQID